LLFLTYPLGSGTYLGFTDAKIGRAGQWVGLENFEFLWGDAVTQLALFNTLFYTLVASVIKFGLGLWLALLLNKHIPFKAAMRAVVLLPFIVPTALSAIAFWWIYDSQFSIISWGLLKLGIINQYIDFLGSRGTRASRRSPPTSGAACRSSPSRCWPGCRPFRRRTTKAASLDGASPWQQFRYVTLPLLTPIIAVVMTVLGADDVHRLSADLRADARRAPQFHAPHGHAVVPARDFGRQPGRGRGHRDGDGALSAGGDPLELLRFATPRLAAGRSGQMSAAGPSQGARPLGGGGAKRRFGGDK
jgi:hypothetical protein